MKDRIIKFLTHESITSTRFADEIGVQRSSISHILSGRNNPSFEFIHKILSRYKSISAEWLIMGNGSMYKIPEQLDLFAPPKPLATKTQALETVPITTEISSSPEGDKNRQIITDMEITASRKVDKILVFYTDKTFDEFTHGK